MSRSEAKRIAAQLLTDVGIVDTPRVLKSYPHQISGGMAQRVAIALALAGKPSLLIADEPTTALDVTIQAEILDLLRGLIAERGMSIILVTHDLGVVADLCDDVSVMYAGEIVETGSVRDVLMRPEHPYTMALLAADPHAITDLDGTTRLASIPGQVPLPGSWTSGCRFAPRCRFAKDECLVTVPLEPRAVGRAAPFAACDATRCGVARKSGDCPPRREESDDRHPEAAPSRMRPWPRPLLEVRNLVVRYGKKGPAAVDDVSFTIARGETLGLVGESGSGQDDDRSRHPRSAARHERADPLRGQGHHPGERRGAPRAAGRPACRVPGPVLVAQSAPADRRRASPSRCGSRACRAPSATGA